MASMTNAKLKLYEALESTRRPGEYCALCVVRMSSTSVGVSGIHQKNSYLKFAPFIAESGVRMTTEALYLVDR
jgi:hypothetical protein